MGEVISRKVNFLCKNLYVIHLTCSPCNLCAADVEWSIVRTTVGYRVAVFKDICTVLSEFVFLCSMSAFFVFLMSGRRPKNLFYNFHIWQLVRHKLSDVYLLLVCTLFELHGASDRPLVCIYNQWSGPQQ